MGNQKEGREGFRVFILTNILSEIPSLASDHRKDRRLRKFHKIQLIDTKRHRYPNDDQYLVMLWKRR